MFCMYVKLLEYFNNSLYFKSYMRFYPGTKKSAENGHFLEFRGLKTSYISQFSLTPLQLIPDSKLTFYFYFGFSIRE